MGAAAMPVAIVAGLVFARRGVVFARTRGDDPSDCSLPLHTPLPVVPFLGSICALCGRLREAALGRTLAARGIRISGLLVIDGSPSAICYVGRRSLGLEFSSSVEIR